METLSQVLEILKMVVQWLLGRRERKQQHKQAVKEAEQKLDDVIDNGNTVGEISEAIRNLQQAHQD